MELIISEGRKLAVTKQRAEDKNLQNVVKDLKHTSVNSHQAQQLQQDTNDRRHKDALNHDPE